MALVAADAVLTSNVTVGADVELSAATQVEITSNIAKIEYVRSGSGRTSEITDTNSDDTAYVLAGETLVETGTDTTTGKLHELTVAAARLPPPHPDEAADGAGGW